MCCDLHQFISSRSLNLNKVSLGEVNFNIFTGFVWLGRKAKSELLKLFGAHQLAVTHKHVTIDFGRLAKLVIEPVLNSREAGLHGTG